MKWIDFPREVLIGKYILKSWLKIKNKTQSQLKKKKKMALVHAFKKIEVITL